MRIPRVGVGLREAAAGCLLVLAVATALVLTSFVAPAPRTAKAAASTVPACAAGSASNGYAEEVPLNGDAASPAPPITARTAVVIDGDTGRVLYDQGAHDRMPPASTTKIMTALLTIEHGDLGRTVISDVDGSEMIGSSVMGLRPGVPITIEDLLYGLMLPSGNDAAVLLAENVAGSVPAFVDQMNAKAAEIGLTDTHFVNPHGLDSRQHYSTAYDLARLARYAMREPEFAAVVATTDWHLAPPSDYDLHNGNSLLQTYPGADGVKIGWTDDAGWTLVASATRDGRRLFAVVLASADRDADASALLDWAFGNYRWVRLAPRTLGQVRLAERLGMNSALFQSLAVCG